VDNNRGPFAIYEFNRIHYSSMLTCLANDKSISIANLKSNRTFLSLCESVKTRLLEDASNSNLTTNTTNTNTNINNNYNYNFGVRELANILSAFNRLSVLDSSILEGERGRRAYDEPLLN